MLDQHKHCQGNKHSSSNIKLLNFNWKQDCVPFKKRPKTVNYVLVAFLSSVFKNFLTEKKITNGDVREHKYEKDENTISKQQTHHKQNTTMTYQNKRAFNTL
jgi:hypothetical protein